MSLIWNLMEANVCCHTLYQSTLSTWSGRRVVKQCSSPGRSLVYNWLETMQRENLCIGGVLLSLRWLSIGILATIYWEGFDFGSMFKISVFIYWDSFTLLLGTVWHLFYFSFLSFCTWSPLIVPIFGIYVLISLRWLSIGILATIYWEGFDSIWNMFVCNYWDPFTLLLTLVLYLWTFFSVCSIYLKWEGGSVPEFNNCCH